jgi:hypothetical protein
MMTTLLFTAEILGYICLAFFTVCFIYGFIVGEEGGVEPLRLSDDKSTPLSDQDLYAIATGDEEYLAAHCTLDPKVEIQNEKFEIQRLKNKLARMKVEQEILSFYTKSAQPAKTTKDEPKPKPAKKKVSPLIQDCVNALVSLGEKERTARHTVLEYFEENPLTNTVDEFIAGVFKK